MGKCNNSAMRDRPTHTHTQLPIFVKILIGPLNAPRDSNELMRNTGHNDDMKTAIIKFVKLQDVLLIFKIIDGIWTCSIVRVKFYCYNSIISARRISFLTYVQIALHEN